MRRCLLCALVCLGAIALSAAPAAANWTTYHADAALSGVDQSSGAAVPFAKAWTVPSLPGPVWAEPLVFNGLVFTVTESNDVYAFSEATGAPVWHVNLGPAVSAGSLPCGDISPTVGITSTPVIDPATGVLYVVADQASGSSAVHTLVALNAGTGAQLFSRSVEPPGDIPLNQLQRESLALDQGRVLIGFGGNDGDCAQYRGYLISAPADDNGANAVYAVPTSREGAIWSGGGAPAVDAAGNVYAPTGNAANGPGQPYDHGDTLEKLSPLAAELDYWAPATWAQDSASDADLGSVSPELLGNNLVFQGGKNGRGYLVSTLSLGHIGGELYSAPVCNSFGADAWVDGILYVACSGGIKALDISPGTDHFSVRWSGPGDASGPPIFSGGLIWVTSPADAKLYGLDPSTGAVIVNQSTSPMEHFVTPAASDGKLFLATGTSLQAYTIAQPVLPAPKPAPPPGPKPATVCRAAVAISLRVPRHERIVRVAVYSGPHRVLLARGRRLHRVRLRRLSLKISKLRVVETPHRGRRLTFTVRIRGCRVRRL